ncbi:MAG: dihydrofolate synthase/folylpolyglutamate synthase [Myxococcota bacterium]|jgi:dihydrofolate synthase/folylpolyglutamate synthase
MKSHPVLEGLAAAGVRLGLDRIRQFLTAMGEPHQQYPVVHVAGTNGKGSTCAYVTEALVAAGYRVGTFTSPHLEHVNERVRFDGIPVDDGSLVAAIESVDRARWDFARTVGISEQPLTYFEMMTAVAFQLFAERRVDVAVVEVGLGGRLDATNVVKPVVCAITHVGMDHMDVLGDTVEAIAAEKAGIIERGVPVVVGAMRPAARAVIENIARRRDAPLWVPGAHLRRELRRDGWVLATPMGVLEGVQLQMPGLHQGANALVALGVLHRLRELGFLVDDEAITVGLSRARLSGRIERPVPGLVVDGAHNVDGAAALSLWLGAQPRPASRILLFGHNQDRDPVATILPLLAHVDEVVTTRCAHPKARDPMDLALALQDLDVTLSAGGNIDDTLAEIYQEADETVVAGSLYLAGAVSSLLRDGLLEGLSPGGGPAGELREIQLD